MAEPQSLWAYSLGQDHQEVMPPGDVGRTRGMAVRRGHGDPREGYDPPEGTKYKARGCRWVCLSLS